MWVTGWARIAAATASGIETWVQQDPGPGQGAAVGDGQTADVMARQAAQPEVPWAQTKAGIDLGGGGQDIGLGEHDRLRGTAAAAGGNDQGQRAPGPGAGVCGARRQTGQVSGGAGGPGPLGRGQRGEPMSEIRRRSMGQGQQGRPEPGQGVLHQDQVQTRVLRHQHQLAGGQPKGTEPVRPHGDGLGQSVIVPGLGGRHYGSAAPPMPGGSGEGRWGHAAAPCLAAWSSGGRPRPAPWAVPRRRSSASMPLSTIHFLAHQAGASRISGEAVPVRR